MKLIIGLGNPGQQYAGTRHNFGFMVINHLAEEFGVAWRPQSKFQADIAETRFGGQRVLLARPTAFYNLTGEATAKIANFYKILPADVLAIHDELALQFGVVRTRFGGSDAGNNGIKNLTEHLGLGYARIRLGIAGQQGSKPAETFVLEPFSAAEQAKLGEIITTATRFAEDFIHEDKDFARTSVKISLE